MTDLIFNDPDEARAWDGYLKTVVMRMNNEPFELVFRAADNMLLERRKRMAPEKKRETLFFGKPASELTEGELSALAASGIYP